MNLRIKLFIVCFFIMASCSSQANKQSSDAKNQTVKDSSAIFDLLSSKESGISFTNTIIDTNRYTPYNTLYVYNGGGVAIGDINNDDMQDIFLTGNQVADKLYLNKGNMEFKDITRKAGVYSTEGWSTGTIMADINNDGLNDIYVCKSGSKKEKNKPNKLFINKGNLAFEESAAEYNLEHNGPTTHTAFFDYDNDGDLDAYILNHPDNFDIAYDIGFYRDTCKNELWKDRLLENRGKKFVDVTKEAGINHTCSFGLAVLPTDVNKDGYTDLYISNDFVAENILYINNGDGTFMPQTKKYFSQTPFFSMGGDFGDLNNDLHQDMMTVDMQPPSHYRRKKYTYHFPQNYYWMIDKAFGVPQRFQNMLYLKNEPNKRFLEISDYSNMARTDWSWSVLFADFDNNRFKDIHITNGTKREFFDMDYVKKMYDKNDNPAYRNDDEKGLLIENMPSINYSNYMFKNNGHLNFSKIQHKWGVDQKVNSNGSAYGDLDNDGDLDLFINNVDTLSFIYENVLDGKRNFVRVIPQMPNHKPIMGTKVILYHPNGQQYHEINNVRGFQSSSEKVAHFGLGGVSTIDSLKIIWPNGKMQVKESIKINKTITVEYKPDHRKIDKNHRDSDKTNGLIVKNQFKTSFTHKETSFLDYERDRLLHKLLSRQGPGLAVSDINNDGLYDCYISGAKGQKGAFYVQKDNGEFTLSQNELDSLDSGFEETGVLFFDVNGDQHKDMYLASGSNEFSELDARQKDRLYLNDGNGNFQLDEDALPQIQISTSTVTAEDCDNDGDLDLFVGGRLTPTKYPMPGKSFLLENRNGKLVDVTDTIAPAIRNCGMVTSALWSDYNNDGLTDLLVVGEWMPITIFKNNGKSFENTTSKIGLEQTKGWWNSISGGDIDNDGDTDYILGNYGLNSIFEASNEEPLSILSNDFDSNGTLDPILFHYLKGKNGTFAMRNRFVSQMPSFNTKFQTFESFAKATKDSLFTQKQIQNSYSLKAYELKSSVLINEGNGNFSLEQLPKRAQFAPVYGSKPIDLNQDHYLDLLLVGNTNTNFYTQGASEALNGLVLMGDGKGNFTYNDQLSDEFQATGFCKSISVIKHHKDDSLSVIVGRNDDSPLKFSINKSYRTITFTENKRKAFIIHYEGGMKRKVEKYHGSGYLSQNPQVIVSNPVDSITYDFD